MDNGVKLLLKQTFKISDDRFYYLKRKYEQQSLNFDESLKNLRENGYIVNYNTWYSNEPLPRVVFLSSPQMQNYYRHFHDCVAFDITYKLCR
jgi:hypothetical protein